MCLVPQSALAGIVVYSATDVGAGPGSPTPNASAAAASFDSSVMGESIITFESSPVGPFTSLVAAPGVTVTGQDAGGNDLYINDVPNYPSDPALDGFNTTPGGANYLEEMGGSATFTFSTPIQYFGAYFTGVQPGFFTDNISFFDGSSEVVNITNPTTFLGGVTFVGFTDAGTSISSVTINTGTPSGADYIGIDDVRYGSMVTPEPATFWMAAGMLLLLGLRARKARRFVA